MKPDRATRIHEEPYTLTTCPVCNREVVGTLTVGVRVGAVTVTKAAGPAGVAVPQATVDVSTEMRSLAFSHDCSKPPPPVADPGLEGQSLDSATPPYPETEH